MSLGLGSPCGCGTAAPDVVITSQANGRALWRAVVDRVRGDRRIQVVIGAVLAVVVWYFFFKGGRRG